MNQFEFFKDLYTAEDDRRYAINDAISIPIAIITALVSITFFLLTTYDYSRHGFASWLFIGLVVLSIFLIFRSVYSLIRAFSNLIHGHKYKGLPYPQQLLDWHKQLISYYTVEEGGRPVADVEFQKHLVNEFAEYASFNMKVNDQKSQYLFIAKKYMVLGLVSITIACIPFSYNYFRKTSDGGKIEIVNAGLQPNTPTTNERREEINSSTNGAEETNTAATTQGQNNSRREGATSTPNGATSPSGSPTSSTATYTSDTTTATQEKIK